MLSSTRRSSTTALENMSAGLSQRCHLAKQCAVYHTDIMLTLHALTRHFSCVCVCVRLCICVPIEAYSFYRVPVCMPARRPVSLAASRPGSRVPGRRPPGRQLHATRHTPPATWPPKHTFGVQRAPAPMCEDYSQKRDTSSDSAKLVGLSNENQVISNPVTRM